MHYRYRAEQRLPVSADSSTISRALYHIRHQLLLTHLLSLIPTLPTVLAPVLVKNFPHKRESEVAMSVYVRNVLDLVEVCPEVAVTVWEVVIDRMIRIDASPVFRCMHLRRLRANPRCALCFVGGNPNRARGYGRRR